MLTRRIGVAVNLSTHSLRGTIAGIVRYAKQRGNWRLAMPADFGLDVFDPRKPDGLDGIISYPANPITFGQVPTIYIGTPFSDNRVPSICADHAATGIIGARHLLELGVPYLACLGCDHATWSALRISAFEAEVIRHRRQCIQRPADATPDTLGAWLVHLPRPCGLFCADDIVAVRAIDVATKMGIRIPEQLAVLGVNNDDLCCNAVVPALSSVDIPLDEIGFEAARYLDRMINGVAYAPGIIAEIKPTGVVQRASTQILGYDDPILCDALRLIRTRAPHEAVTVEAIAGDLHVHRLQLTRSFTEHVGHSPKDEIDRVRGERLQELLQAGNLPIKRIAYEMGFASPGELSRFCRRILKVPPSRLRPSVDR